LRGHIFPSQEGDEASGQRLRPESGVGFLKRGQSSPPHQLARGSGKRRKLSQQGPGRAPGNLKFGAT